MRPGELRPVPGQAGAVFSRRRSRRRGRLSAEEAARGAVGGGDDRRLVGEVKEEAQGDQLAEGNVQRQEGHHVAQRRQVAVLGVVVGIVFALTANLHREGAHPFQPQHRRLNVRQPGRTEGVGEHRPRRRPLVDQLRLEDVVLQRRPLKLGHLKGRQGAVEVAGDEAEDGAVVGATGAAGPLLRRRLRAPVQREGAAAAARVSSEQLERLAEAKVNHEFDIRNGQRGLGDVGGENEVP